MGRPKNKEELLSLSQINFEKLFNMIEDLTLEEKQGSFIIEDRDKNIKDVIYHLYEWHNMFLTWYEVGMKGNKPVMPREGYTWKTTGEMNLMIWNMYKDYTLEQGINSLKKTHLKIMDIIKGHSDEELFTKKYYSWTGTTSLGSYLVSATSSHYDWAIKKIRKQIKFKRAENKN